MSEFFDVKVATLVQHFAIQFPSFSLKKLRESGSEFDGTLYGFFSEMLHGLYLSDNLVELRRRIKDLPLFPIENDVTPFLFEWGGALYESGVTREAGALSADYMSVFVRDVFHLDDDYGETSDLGVLWSVAVEALPVNRRRFLALCFYYLITSNFTLASAEFTPYMRTVESFFKIRSYLLLGDDYPAEFELDDVDFSNLKSLFQASELHLLKALTAAGGVAQSVEREDLESGIVNTVTRGELEEKTKRKKYTRRVPLE